MIMNSMIAFLELGLDDLIPESKGTLSHLWSAWPSNTLHVKFRPISLSPERSATTGFEEPRV